jgi:hypothetical protein
MESRLLQGAFIASKLGDSAMDPKEDVAVSIALQTHVFRTCPVHNQIFCDEEVDPAVAFALAVELVRKRQPYAGQFLDDAHRLTDLLSDTIGAAPDCCPQCAAEHAASDAPHGARIMLMP